MHAYLHVHVIHQNSSFIKIIEHPLADLTVLVIPPLGQDQDDRDNRRAGDSDISCLC